LYRDRIHAGEVLLANIKERGLRESLFFVFGIPRGGVEVAFPIAEDLKKIIVPLVVHKIPSSINSEFAIGAISATGEFILNEYAAQEPKEYIKVVKHDLLVKLLERQKHFGVNINFGDIHGKEVLVVDDGIATGETVLLGVRTLLTFSPSKIYVAVPVSSYEGYEMVSKVSSIICPIVDRYFYAVGGYYENFSQLTEEETKKYIDESKEFEKRE
jgi:predicted phosphoribosyltransferase